MSWPTLPARKASPRTLEIAPHGIEITVERAGMNFEMIILFRV